jgi:hypothetical protein
MPHYRYRRVHVAVGPAVTTKCDCCASAWAIRSLPPVSKHPKSKKIWQQAMQQLGSASQEETNPTTYRDYTTKSSFLPEGNITSARVGTDLDFSTTWCIAVFDKPRQREMFEAVFFIRSSRLNGILPRLVLHGNLVSGIPVVLFLAMIAL